MKSLKVSILSMILIIFGCGDNQNVSLHTLSSGKQIRVISVTTIFFSDGVKALKLDYQTDLQVSDSIMLRNEVEEIWRDFNIDAERAKVDAAIITANEIPVGTLIRQGKVFNFSFRKKPDGNWKMLKD